MTITNAEQYIAAVAKKKHLEGLLEQKQNEFSGYGRELFESSMRASLERLDGSIKKYEAVSGYKESTRHLYWIGEIQSELFEVTSGVVFPIPSIVSQSFAAPKPVLLLSSFSTEVRPSVSDTPQPLSFVFGGNLIGKELANAA